MWLLRAVLPVREFGFAESGDEILGVKGAKVLAGGS